MPRRRRNSDLAALRNEGRIRRVARGLYLLEPPEQRLAPALETAEPSETTRELASFVFWPCYIGGWSAAHHWGLSAVDNEATFVVTAARLRRTDVERACRRFHAVRVTEEYLEGPGVDELVTGPAEIASPERTIVDALNHPAWLGGALHVANALLEYARYGLWKEERLYRVMDGLLTGAGLKRLAAFIRCRNLHEYSMLRLEFWDRRTTGIVDLSPGEGRSGRVDYPSRVRLNADLDPEDEEDEYDDDEMAASD